MHRCCMLLTATAFVCVALPRLSAQPSLDKVAIEQELDVVLKSWEEAFNRHDAQAVAMTYATECDVEHNFEKMGSRQAIEEQTAKYFLKNPQVQTQLVDIKRVILSPTAVVESGTWTEWNHTEVGRAKRGSYITTLVKSNGKWRAVHERAFPNTHVFPAFFLNAEGGSWHEQAGRNAIDTYQWVLGQKFMQFTSRMGDSKTFGMIGADPRTGDLTWWVFHNDGSVETRQPSVETPVPGEHLMKVKSDTGKTEIAMQITFESDDEVHLIPAGQINGVQFQNTMHWKRDKQIADHGWLYTQPPKDIPASMSSFQAVNGSKWISSEIDGVAGVGAAHGSWILDGKFFLSCESFTSLSQSTWSHLYVIGTDPKTGLMTHGWEFSSDGAFAEFELSPDGKALTGKSFGGMFGTIDFSGKLDLSHGVLDYKAQLTGSALDKPVPYRWVYRDAQAVDH